MKKRYVSRVVLTSLLLMVVGCSGKSGSSLSSGSMLSGVAATGAPISGGAIEVKGSNGDSASGTTNSDGTYSVNVGALSSPYLIRVIAPSGEKYISVASQSDLAEGRPVNVTPLTHTIVANVFGSADADELFTNFESESSEFTEDKLDEEKDELVQKFIDAGLLGAGKIADADIDLMNGEFVAGTSEGIDALLDVIQVNTDASAGVEIKLKGAATPIITDKYDGTADPAAVAILPAELAAANEQLTVLETLRAHMNSLASLHSSKVGCNGTPVDDGSSCDVDTLYNAFLPYFHSSFQEDGASRSEAVWGWFCRVGDDDEAESKAECLASGEIYFENVSLKDITLISYDSTNDIALINFNFYLDGVLKGQEEILLKLESGTYNLLGNRKTFEYWIDSESLHSTVYNKSSNTGTDSYSVNLKFYYEGSGSYTFDGDEVFTLTADSGHDIFPGNSDSMSLYLVVGPNYDSNGSCSSGLVFSTTANPYRMINQSTGVESYTNYATACAFSNDPCDCRPSAGAFAWFDHDTAQRVSITAAQVALMDKSETISLSGAGVASDKFVIAKPLLVNQYNAADHIPSFGMTAANFCENVTFTTSLNLSVATGYLSYLSIHHSFSDSGGSTWKNENDSENYWETSPTSAVYTPDFGLDGAGDVIQHSHLYLSARDEYERQFVRQVTCEFNP